MMRYRLPIAFSGLLALGGCVTLSPDGGMSAVSESVRAEIGKNTIKVVDEDSAANAGQRARSLLGKGLSADRAVQIALLNNKGLQAAYNELGMSEAKFVQASQPPNPAISIMGLRGHLEFEIERRLIGDLLALLTLPTRREIAKAGYRKAELEAIGATVRLASDVRRQYWRAVGANAQVGYLQQARGAAEAVSELAKKLGETGAMNKLDQGREHAFYAELSAQLARARTQQRVEKERLTRLLGLWGADVAFNLPASLPALPGKLTSSAQIEARALERRIDLKIARADLDRLALELGLTNATRYVNALELSGVHTSTGKTTVDADGVKKERSNLGGLELKIEIPLYDFGAARKRDAEETYMRSANLLAEKAVNIRSEAREGYFAYRGAHDVARLYQSRILPLRKKIQDESLLHYSAMLADVFVLLQDARARITSNTAAIDARRDFFVADAELKAAMLSGNMGGGAMKAQAPSEAGQGGAEH